MAGSLRRTAGREAGAKHRHHRAGRLSCCGRFYLLLRAAGKQVLKKSRESWLPGNSRNPQRSVLDRIPRTGEVDENSGSAVQLDAPILPLDPTEAIIMPQRLLCLLLATLLCSVGCQEGPTSGRPLGDAPDGVVEILSVDKDGKIQHVEGKFLEAVNRTDSRLVLVDCWAEWCGPCRKLGPILEEVKKSWGDKLEVVKVDIDQNPEIAQHLRAESIPDVRIFRSGTQIGEFVGLMPRAEIEGYLKSLE